MKTKVFALLSICISPTTIAQTLKGRVIDKEEQPIELATVVLQTIDSIYINTTYTDSLGYFQFKESPKEFNLIIQHLLFETVSRKYTSSQIGRVVMESKIQELDEVVIKGEQPVVKIVEGKMTYNMPQLLKNKMTTNAYEALLELPGVSEQNNKITLAGANAVRVILNGRPTTISEDQLTILLKNTPKEQVQSAEVSYNAPPEYHIRGAVINININNKTSKTPSIQGQVNTSYEQKYYANYQGGFSLVYNRSKSLTSLIYSNGYTKTKDINSMISNHLFHGDIHNIVQRDRTSFNAPLHSIRLANDWSLNKGGNMNLTYTSQITPWSHSQNDSFGEFSNAKNKKNSKTPIQMHNLSLNYNTPSGLQFGVDYTFYKNHTKQNYREKLESKENEFTSNSKQNINQVSIYADQKHQLRNNWTFKYGGKIDFARDKSSQSYQFPDKNKEPTPNRGSRIDEYNYTLYLAFDKAVSEKLYLSTAMAGEYYQHRGKGYWGLFPTLTISYTPRPTSIFQLSITSDKSYPSYWEMQDTKSYLNSYTQVHGNPSLQPSRNYSGQLNYILQQKYIFTLYSSYTAKRFAQLPYQSPNELVLIYQTLNFDYYARLGFNITLPFKVGKILDSRLTINGFYDKFKSDNFHNISFNKHNYVIYTSLDNTFDICSQPNIKAELSGSYISKNIQGPMYISKMYRADAGIKWISRNKNCEINLKINDAFNSWSPKNLVMHYKAQDYKLIMQPDSRSLSISFSYKFGGFKNRRMRDIDTQRFGTK